jgi:hypothetical protein
VSLRLHRVQRYLRSSWSDAYRPKAQEPTAYKFVKDCARECPQLPGRGCPLIGAMRAPEDRVIPPLTLPRGTRVLRSALRPPRTILARRSDFALARCAVALFVLLGVAAGAGIVSTGIVPRLKDDKLVPSALD